MSLPIRPLIPVLLLLVLAVPVPARAASRSWGREGRREDPVSGVVVDGAGAPVSGATVRLVELGLTVRTGADGGFGFPAGLRPGAYTMVVERPGYRSRVLEVEVGAGGGRREIVLEADPIPVDPVTVTAVGGALSPLHSPLPGGAVDRSQLDRDPSISLANTLERLPGVRTLSTGREFGKPVIRGLYGARVVVLSDGMRLEDYAWSDEDAPSVDAAFAERVEVVRGPSAVVYGPDAVGGVVNVIPRPLPVSMGGSATFGGRAEVGIMTNNREVDLAVRGEGTAGAAGVAGVAGVAGAWGWRTGLTGRIAEALHTPEGELENTGFGAVNGEAALARRGRWGDVTARFVHFGGEFKLLEEDAAPSAPEEEEEGPERKLADDRLQLLGNFPLGAGGGLRLETRLQGQRHHLIELEDDPEALAQGIRREVEIFDLVLTTGLGEAILHHRLAEGVTGTAGVSGEVQGSAGDGAIPLIPDASTASAGAFVLERLEAGRVTVLAGARADLEEVDPEGGDRRRWTALTWSAGAAWRPVERLALTANVGRAWRPPTLFELYADGPRLGEGRYEIGDAGLDEERALDVDVGLRWSGGRVTAQLAAFRNAFDGYLFAQPAGEVRDGYEVFRYEQAGATLAGGEASLAVVATDHVAVAARADYVRGTNEDRDEPLPLIPPARVDLRAELHGDPPAEGAPSHVGIEGRYVAAPERLNPYDFDVGGYALVDVDAGTTVTVAGRRLEVGLRVRNLLNESYRDFLSRYKRFALNPGRDLVLRVRTDF